MFLSVCLQVLIRMQQYKDDLLASCLRLVLSLPLEIVKLDVASFVPAVKVNKNTPMNRLYFNRTFL